MSNVIIVGDGPGGLGAALFLAKNGMDVTVYGDDKTAMHWAYLYNYLGIKAMSGTDFQKVSREQVVELGADLRAMRVSKVEKDDDSFVVTTDDGQTQKASYVILAEGKGARFSKEMGLTVTKDGVDVDRNGRSAIDKLYVVGRGTKIQRSQAVISAGEGAATALDILSIEKGEDFCDFDTPPKDE
ncbi:MAG: FAD-dependent oxidoreductase [Chloroflexota bacterium]